MGSVIGNFPGDFAQIFFAVNRYGYNDGVGYRGFFQEIIQLAKLSDTKRSPVAAIEYQDNIFPVPIIRKGDPFVIRGFQGKIGSGNALNHTTKIGCRQVAFIS
jgi:hypothetical protein